MITEHVRCRACGEGYTVEPGAGWDGPCDDGDEHDPGVVLRDADGRLVAGAADGTWWSRETGSRRVDVGDHHAALEEARSSAERWVRGVAA